MIKMDPIKVLKYGGMALGLIASGLTSIADAKMLDGKLNKIVEQKLKEKGL